MRITKLSTQSVRISAAANSSIDKPRLTTMPPETVTSQRKTHLNANASLMKALTFRSSELFSAAIGLRIHCPYPQ
jgi:hypothetical protein